MHSPHAHVLSKHLLTEISNINVSYGDITANHHPRNNEAQRDRELAYHHMMAHLRSFISPPELALLLVPGFRMYLALIQVTSFFLRKSYVMGIRDEASPTALTKAFQSSSGFGRRSFSPSHKLKKH
jgi:hypothetical protein